MSDFNPDVKNGVYRVTHHIRVGDKRMIAESDFIFDGEKLLLVLEWTHPDTNQFPLVTLELDPARLTELPSSPGRYVYNGDLVDPRPRH